MVCMGLRALVLYVSRLYLFSAEGHECECHIQFYKNVCIMQIAPGKLMKEE